ncbi:hypothetical protein [Bacillus sp. SG-1]|uniref:hypothetical protein n=1 Tax=Bacillus sp. SG-1 TaxID=161544 RepID=UPI0001543653|nr:hypothetical protein [Bacillus sp. SG-1]EDL66552.1 hypothetical protein BSG1_04330 [Bacillus sp. SG-1]
MSPLKRILFYILYISVVLTVLYYGLQYEHHLLEKSKETFTLSRTLHWYSVVFSIVVGVLLAIPNLFYNLYKNGAWTYDWIRSAIIGIPSLFITLVPVLYWVIPELFQFLTGQFIYLAGSTEILPTVTGILFGYTMISSLRVKE